MKLNPEPYGPLNHSSFNPLSIFNNGLGSQLFRGSKPKGYSSEPNILKYTTAADGTRPGFVTLPGSKYVS
jgi:hypothetical protein